jgi:hypothetical protein
MDVILDNSLAEANARQLLARMPLVNLDDIVFVGEHPALNTITTLPSTFPEGDLRHATWEATQRGIQEGRTVAALVRDGLRKILVKSYYHGNVPYATQPAKPLYLQVREMAASCLTQH